LKLEIRSFCSGFSLLSIDFRWISFSK
jgi:hypothetical protein